MKRFIKSFYIIHIMISIVFTHTIIGMPYLHKQISFSFLSLYPESSLKNLVSMVMRLWTEVNELQHNSSDHTVVHSYDTFAQQVLLLNTALDTTLIDAARNMHECPECIYTILYDMQQLLNVIKELTKGYALILTHCKEKHVAPAASLYILEHIINKMTKIIEHEAIPSNLYSTLKRPSRLLFNTKKIDWLNLA